MAHKYHIETWPVANRFPAITRSGVMPWEEGCLKCPRCVKKDCVYLVYAKRALDTRQMLDSVDSICKDCFRCVQNCPARLIQKGTNPTYRVLGDAYWTPEIISGLWFQAETGRIPVSGGGYGGPFSGPGFDAMWTDMSEIVRPTRDGIHGREYISTMVEMGRKHMGLRFDGEGNLLSPALPFVEIPLPVIFDRLPWSPPAHAITLAFLQAAEMLGTFAYVNSSRLVSEYEPYLKNMLLYLDGDPSRMDWALLSQARLFEIPDGLQAMSWIDAIKGQNPEAVVSIRLPMRPETSRRACELAAGGAEILHLVADERGMEQAGQAKPLFIKDRMKEIHLYLVEQGVRDKVSILAGGGIAMAAHMAKLIICGADAVACDIPLLIAMECRVCRRCAEGISCPVDLDRVDPAWGAARIRNLMAGWHNQLLEVLGAMGIREVRRLRGEMGRAMFMEDLEKEFQNLGPEGGER